VGRSEEEITSERVRKNSICHEAKYYELKEASLGEDSALKMAQKLQVAGHLDAFSNLGLPGMLFGGPCFPHYKHLTT
jgi:hypothetical protein